MRRDAGTAAVPASPTNAQNLLIVTMLATVVWTVADLRFKATIRIQTTIPIRTLIPIQTTIPIHRKRGIEELTAMVMVISIVTTAFVTGGTEIAALTLTAMGTLTATTIGYGARAPEMAAKTETDAFVDKTGLPIQIEV